VIANRLPARRHDKLFFGLETGIVVENIDPDKEGRIKVGFEWFDEGTKSEWCRLAELYAGPGFGSCFVPEVGTQVVLAFMKGSMHEPIVLGGLYSRKHKPPADRQRDEKKNQKLIRTKGGHSILLDDTDSKKKVVVSTHGGHSVTLDDQSGKITVHDSNGAEIEIAKDGSISLSTGKGQSVALDVPSNTIKLSATTITLSATTVTLSAPNVQLGGTDFGSVLGEKLQELFNSHTHPNASGSTLPPSQQMGNAQLSKKVRTG
jgi:uncharacterized protein involved in type VI secretion and phage assembly